MPRLRNSLFVLLPAMTLAGCEQEKVSMQRVRIITS